MSKARTTTSDPWAMYTLSFRAPNAQAAMETAQRRLDEEAEPGERQVAMDNLRQHLALFDGSTMTEDHELQVHMNGSVVGNAGDLLSAGSGCAIARLHKPKPAAEPTTEEAALAGMLRGANAP